MKPHSWDALINPLAERGKYVGLACDHSYLQMLFLSSHLYKIQKSLFISVVITVAVRSYDFLWIINRFLQISMLSQYGNCSSSKKIKIKKNIYIYIATICGRTLNNLTPVKIKAFSFFSLSISSNCNTCWFSPKFGLQFYNKITWASSQMIRDGSYTLHVYCDFILLTLKIVFKQSAILLH